MLKEKLEKVIELVDNTLSNPDIELEYHNVESGESATPYILLKYAVNGSSSHIHEQKITLKEDYLQKTPEDIANLVTFHIEQFIAQIDSVEYGAQ